MRWWRKQRFRFLRGQSGIGLIEVLVATVILGLIGVGVVSAIDTNFRANRTLDEQVTAANLATAYFEAIRELPYEKTYPEYSSAGDNIALPPQYTVDIDVDYSDDGNIWVDTYTDEKLQRVTIFVSRDGGKPVLSICTYRTER